MLRVAASCFFKGGKGAAVGERKADFYFCLSIYIYVLLKGEYHQLEKPILLIVLINFDLTLTICRLNP